MRSTSGAPNRVQSTLTSAEGNVRACSAPVRVKVGSPNYHFRQCQSAVERELVLRLASLLWRLRRATTMETGLFEIQAERLRGYRQAHQTLPHQDIIMFGRDDLDNHDLHIAAQSWLDKMPTGGIRLMVLLSSLPDAFCVWPICPTSRSVASAALSI